MNQTLYIVPIEPIDARYTRQWYDNIPGILAETGYDIVTIDGSTTKGNTTPGAFLDFGATNEYKATQTQRIAQLFTNQLINAGDAFLVTDAWNFTITAIRYMSSLLNVPVKIFSIWHAGSYDPTDILGMKMDTSWSHEQERAWYYASDYNFFATHFHRDMFVKALRVDPSKSFVSGQPHNPLIHEIAGYAALDKEDFIMFPHRLNSDKQPEIVEDMAKELNYQVIINQKMGLSKQDYYKMLGKARAIFSCSLHENLGISMMEGVLAGAIPIVPDRASYSEMYLDVFKYPSKWTSSLENYNRYRGYLIDFVESIMRNPYLLQYQLQEQKNILIRDYLTASVMVSKIKENHANT